MTHKTAKFQPKFGDVVIVKSENKNRGRWPLATVNEIFPGKDENFPAVQLKTANGIIERPVQHLYPLELTCDRVRDKCTNTATISLNPSAPVFRPRPVREASVAARARIKDLTEDNFKTELYLDEVLIANC